MDKNKKLINTLVDIALFAAITLLFHRLWWQNAVWIKSIPFMANSALWLAHQVFLASSWIDKHILFISITKGADNLMMFSNGGYIRIEESCSGLKQMYQLFFLFLLFPGPWKHKTWFIPTTFVVMFFTNIFRILILSGAVLYLPSHWDFIHLWIMRPFYYLVIFLLWVWWEEKFHTSNNHSMSYQL